MPVALGASIPSPPRDKCRFPDRLTGSGIVCHQVLVSETDRFESALIPEIQQVVKLALIAEEGPRKEVRWS